MQAYECTICSFLYDDESADKDREGKLIQFEKLDPEWVCPVCGVKQSLFRLTESNRTPDIPIEK